MQKTLKVIAGFAVGAITGLATGILVAPNKGSRTAKKLKKSMKKTSRHVADSIDEQKKHLADQMKQVKGQAAKQGEKIKSSFKN